MYSEDQIKELISSEVERQVKKAIKLEREKFAKFILVRTLTAGEHIKNSKFREIINSWAYYDI